MYERFTDRARKVMQLANQEAQRFNHEYVGTEHILLGLVKEGAGVAANVLKNLGIEPHKICLEVERIVQAGPDMVIRGKLPQTPRAKKVIEYSIEAARNLNHNYVGTEHLLLGLLREEGGVAAQVLMNLGLKQETVHRTILLVLGPDAERAAIQQREWDDAKRMALNWLWQREDRGPLLRAIENQLWNVRLLLSILVGTMTGALLGGPAGAMGGLLGGLIVGVCGGRILGGIAGAIPGPFLACAYFGRELSWSVVGLILGAVIGACIGDIGRPFLPTRFWKSRPPS
jgi:hypothetical protein